MTVMLNQYLLANKVHDETEDTEHQKLDVHFRQNS